MNKLGSVFQIAYIVFAVIFIAEAVNKWSTNRSMSYIFLLGAFVAIFKFLFNRKYRKRFEAHYKKREEEKNKK